MNILEEPLVKKYFGCEASGCFSKHTSSWDAPCMSLRILIGMQEPINVLYRRSRHDGYILLGGHLFMTNTPRDREAREKAKEVFRKVWRGQFVPDNQWQSAMISMIAQALLEFAEEAVRDATIELCEGEDCFVANKEREAHASGYAEGLEKAAKMADLHYETCKVQDIERCPKVIAMEIRALLPTGVKDV